MESFIQDVVDLTCARKSISAYVAIREHGRVEKQERRFCTFTGDLEEMCDWLVGLKVTHIAMEATNVYWKPVWNVLEGLFGLMLVNPQHIKALTGKKWDRRDASHLADLLQHGLLQGSFVPATEIRHPCETSHAIALEPCKRQRASRAGSKKS
jgi:hypothetical protein